MIIDHNRSLPKSGSPHLSTPNKSPSPLPHKPTPQQTAKSQQVHTHQSDESTNDTIKTETTPSDPLLAMVHQFIHTSDDDASDISNVLSVKRSCQIQVCQRYLFQHANHTNQQLVDRDAIGGLAGSDMHVIHKTHHKINIQGIDNHEVTGLDVVTAATNLNTLLDAPPGDCGSYTEISSVFTANLHQSSPHELDWNALCPVFAWTSPSSIKDTFNVTTRYGTAPHTQDYIKKHFKSRNPVFNIPRCSEAVATDTIFSDNPAVDDGSTMAQFFCGRDTLVCDAYGVTSTKQFINTLSDNIRKWGAMDTLISDAGKYEISKRVTDLLCSMKDFQKTHQSCQTIQNSPS